MVHSLVMDLMVAAIVINPVTSLVIVVLTLNNTVPQVLLAFNLLHNNFSLFSIVTTLQSPHQVH